MIEHFNFQLRPKLRQIVGQVGVYDVALQGESITSAAHARNHLLIQVNSFTAVNGQVIFPVQNQGA